MKKDIFFRNDFPKIKEEIIQARNELYQKINAIKIKYDITSFDGISFDEKNILVKEGKGLTFLYEELSPM